MPEQDFLEAANPLFESGEVEVLEWSFDMCWGKKLPSECERLLNCYSDAGTLYGHGVSFSMLTARRTKRQELWLQYLQKEVAQFNYQKISEHFNLLTTDKFIQGAPISMPFIPEMVTIAVENLKQIQEIVQIPVGVENLAFAFSRQDVLEQGKFISAILEAVDGFLLLDIHNIFCNMINFDMSFDEVAATLPLNRVSSIHVSGGSFRTIRHQNKNIYCDSHDAAVPDELFILLEKVLPMFDKLDTIIFERMGDTLINQQEVEQFRDDFFTLKSLIKKSNYERN